MARGRVVPVDHPPIPDGTVIVEDGRVSYAGPSEGEPRAPAGAVELETGGGTIVPGLVDAHVHLTCDGGPDLAGEVVGRGPAELALKAYANARRALARGTVAVRDLGAPDGEAIAVGAALRQGRLTGPEVAAAGRAITAPGGHIPFLGVEVEGPEAMAAAARAELDAGADGIKLVATGGVLTVGVPIGNTAYEEWDLAAAAAVARDAGAWVAAHCIGVEGTKRALRAGATTIEHGALLDDEAIELLLARGATLVATLTVVDRILRLGREGGMAPDALAKCESLADRHPEAIAAAFAAGVPVAAGTDAGTPFNPHGDVADEARLLVERIGMDEPTALRAATLNAASCLGRDDLGRLATGAAGHLLVLGGDPLDDIRALTDVRAVVLAGRQVEPAPA